ncbi:dienelactone hydrolase family protein, partial [bacterium]|nr:dienelactone hydrolase family protein [bacterium]
GFLLLAPSSIGMTWSFQSDRDSRSINSIIDTISKQWNVNREKILLTGFSDGAIYSLTYGLQQSSPFTALAPISGVLHPIDLSYARDRKIYLVHGELDWMFPVDHAHRTYSVLKKAGANVFFQEVKGLSHTYPREVNDQILIWFDSSLSLSV